MPGREQHGESARGKPWSLGPGDVAPRRSANNPFIVPDADTHKQVLAERRAWAKQQTQLPIMHRQSAIRGPIMSALKATRPLVLSPMAARAAEQRPREMEDVRTVIMERRAIYMAEVGIATKKEALANIRASEGEMAQTLGRREEEVEDFVRDFTAFLRVDGRNTMDLRAVAEQACAARKAVSSRILEVSSRLSVLRMEVARATEAYGECREYQEFLCRLTPPDWRGGMYWTDPQQLVRAMAELEESNIFLMLHCEEAESTFRRMKDEFLQMMLHDEASLADEAMRRGSYKEKLSVLQAQVSAQLAAGEDLWGNELGDAEQRELGGAVSDCIIALGLTPGRADDRHSLTAMLQVIEESLESMGQRLGRLDPAKLKRYARDREAQVREEEKRERVEQQRREQEEKQAAALALALKPAVRREGRPVCPRTTPEKRETREAREEHLREQQEARAADERLLFGPLPW